MSLVLVIHNDGTGSTRVGHYDVSVRVNHDEIDRVRVVGHLRAEPWWALVRRVVEAKEADERGCTVCGKVAPLVACRWCGVRCCGGVECGRAVHGGYDVCPHAPHSRERATPPEPDIDF